jgi:hypothetical protein
VRTCGTVQYIVIGKGIGGTVPRDRKWRICGTVQRDREGRIGGRVQRDGERRVGGTVKTNR